MYIYNNVSYIPFYFFLLRELTDNTISLWVNYSYCNTIGLCIMLHGNAILLHLEINLKFKAQSQVFSHSDEKVVAINTKIMFDISRSAPLSVGCCHVPSFFMGVVIRLLGENLVKSYSSCAHVWPFKSFILS